MKKLFAVLLMGVVFFGIASPSQGGLFGPDEFFIRVTGTKGLKVDGAISVLTGSKSKDESITVTIPWEKKVEADIISVVFQKMSAKGMLKVELLNKKGEVLNEGETSSEYGIVSVTSD